MAEPSLSHWGTTDGSTISMSRETQTFPKDYGVNETDFVLSLQRTYTQEIPHTDLGGIDEAQIETDGINIVSVEYSQTERLLSDNPKAIVAGSDPTTVQTLDDEVRFVKYQKPQIRGTDERITIVAIGSTELTTSQSPHADFQATAQGKKVTETHTYIPKIGTAADFIVLDTDYKCIRISEDTNPTEPTTNTYEFQKFVPNPNAVGNDYSAHAIGSAGIYIESKADFGSGAGGDYAAAALGADSCYTISHTKRLSAGDGVATESYSYTVWPTTDPS